MKILISLPAGAGTPLRRVLIVLAASICLLTPAYAFWQSVAFGCAIGCGGGGGTRLASDGMRELFRSSINELDSRLEKRAAALAADLDQRSRKIIQEEGKKLLDDFDSRLTNHRNSALEDLTKLSQEFTRDFSASFRQSIDETMKTVEKEVAKFEGFLAASTILFMQGLAIITGLAIAALWFWKYRRTMSSVAVGITFMVIAGLLLEGLSRLNESRWREAACTAYESGNLDLWVALLERQASFRGPRQEVEAAKLIRDYAYNPNIPAEALQQTTTELLRRQEALANSFNFRSSDIDAVLSVIYHGLASTRTDFFAAAQFAARSTVRQSSKMLCESAKRPVLLLPALSAIDAYLIFPFSDNELQILGGELKNSATEFEFRVADGDTARKKISAELKRQFGFTAALKSNTELRAILNSRLTETQFSRHELSAFKRRSKMRIVQLQLSELYGRTVFHHFHALYASSPQEIDYNIRTRDMAAQRGLELWKQLRDEAKAGRGNRAWGDTLGLLPEYGLRLESLLGASAERKISAKLIQLKPEDKTKVCKSTWHYHPPSTPMSAVDSYLSLMKVAGGDVIKKVAVSSEVVRIQRGLAELEATERELFNLAVIWSGREPSSLCGNFPRFKEQWNEIVQGNIPPLFSASPAEEHTIWQLDGRALQHANKALGKWDAVEVAALNGAWTCPPKLTQCESPSSWIPLAVAIRDLVEAEPDPIIRYERLAMNRISQPRL